MTSIKSLYEPSADVGTSLHSDFDVDYVIDYRFATTQQAKAEAQFSKLIQSLYDVGLKTEVRNGDNCTVLVFVRVASDRHLNSQAYRARVQDWLYGVRSAAPGKEIQKSLDDEPISQAERLRIVYLMITKPKSEGGAGITPKHGEWQGVESIFPLHDHQFNKDWIKIWTTKYFLNFDDITKIRDKFGEKIAFYFAFLQSYLMFLIFPAAFGFSCWVLLGQFSFIYGAVNCLWCVGFIEYWKKQEIDLAVGWGVRGVSKIQHKRPQFKHESEVKDPVTGEQIKVYSPVKRLSRQLLQIPFAVVSAVILGTLIATCFGIEIFISEVYDGPFKSYLTFLPTVILTTVLPTLSALLTGFATRLTEIENYETTDAYEAAMVQKVFVLNFITSYLPIFLTAFVYVPFAQIIVPHLDIFQLTVKAFAENEKQMTTPKAGFQINPERLKKQVIYFTVTAQIVNFALEIIVPYVQRKVFKTVKEVRANSAVKRGGTKEHHAANDIPEESAFLVRVRNEAELGVYDVTGDFREMVVQFGYLSLFSVVWPLTAVSFLINNFIELRSDALKITVENQRPVPWRADSIGPWLDALGFLAWLGSLTTSALVFLFSGDGFGPDGTPKNISAWGLLLTIFFSEHIFLAVQLGVRKALSKIDSPGIQRERAERFAVRRQYLEEAMGQEEADHATSGGIVAGEKMNRSTLERKNILIGLEVPGAKRPCIEEARNSTLRGHGTPGERFWQRQQGADETISVGRQLIEKAAPTKTKKEQ
ncbi:MAG: hypothetical protein M1818_007958 [Claussenomyces sp. TS43310]|nr:MAG: hypothetical protein M1818_007958 [Claussenomyces sp. TS43310]